MEQRLEFKRLKQLSLKTESLYYPGYPFSLYGVIDFKTKHCWTTNSYKVFTINNWSSFSKEFDAPLLYHILNSHFTRKGNFIYNTHMDNYKKFLEEPWTTSFNEGDYPIENFYIDNHELTRLYFSVWAAIREYKDSNKFMWFMYDGESEYVDVLLFDNINQINTYAEKYGYTRL